MLEYEFKERNRHSLRKTLMLLKKPTICLHCVFLCVMFSTVVLKVKRKQLSHNTAGVHIVFCEFAYYLSSFNLDVYFKVFSYLLLSKTSDLSGFQCSD